ncbi:MAG: GAF domain-containing protein [Planctomycetota bacterium]
MSEPAAETAPQLARHVDEPERSAPLRPRWTVWLVETVGACVFLGLVNAALAPEDVGWLRVEPHPLYLVPLLIAVRYGFGPGALAGALTAALHLAAQLAAGAPLAGLSAFTPTLLLLSGLVLGELRERQLQREGHHRQESERAREELARLEGLLEVEREARSYLERRIVEPTTSVAMLYEAAQRLEALDEERLYPAILEVLVGHLDARQAGVLALDEGGRLHPRIARGAEEAEAREWCDDPLVSAVLEQRRALSLRDLPGDARAHARRRGAVLAAPLLSPEGEALGALVVLELPFVRLTTHALRTLDMLGGWAGRALSRARYVARIRDASVFDEERGVLRMSYFAPRLNEEFDRAQRYGYPLSVLALRIVAWEDMPPDSRDRTLLAVSTVLTQVLRTVDQVFCHPETHSFMLSLPHTPEAGAKRAHERMVEKLDLLRLEPYRAAGRRLEVAMASATFDPRAVGEATSAELLAELAQRRLLEQEEPGLPGELGPEVADG